MGGDIRDRTGRRPSRLVHAAPRPDPARFDPHAGLIPSARIEPHPGKTEKKTASALPLFSLMFALPLALPGFLLIL